jgi:hypothetical protein
MDRRDGVEALVRDTDFPPRGKGLGSDALQLRQPRRNCAMEAEQLNQLATILTDLAHRTADLRRYL